MPVQNIAEFKIDGWGMLFVWMIFAIDREADIFP